MRVRVWCVHPLLDAPQPLPPKPPPPLPPSACSEATTEDAREKGELQRAYYALLHVIAHSNCIPALLSSPGQVRDEGWGLRLAGEG